MLDTPKDNIMDTQWYTSSIDDESILTMSLIFASLIYILSEWTLTSRIDGH